MDPLQFPRTIEDDEDIEIEESDSEEEEGMVGSLKGSKSGSLFSEGFEFSAAGVGGRGAWNSWDVHEEIVQMAERRQRPLMTSVDVKIARAREMRSLKAEQERENDATHDSDVASSEDDGDDDGEACEAGEGGEGGGGYGRSVVEDDAESLSGDEPESNTKKRPVGVKTANARQTRRLKAVQEREQKVATHISDGSSDESEPDADAESLSGDEPEDTIKIRKTKKSSSSYFEEAPPPQETDVNFTDMNLSRPLLKAVTSLGFVNPTPIQARCVPIALMGKDMCACAATGTGKTAAFMLPILERLLYRPTHTRVSRVLILTPTRELAIQIHSVGKALAKHTSVEFCLASGGLDSKSQEAMLRKNPDVIIATPGRLVDHLHNAPSFSLSTIEILVLDEADRMLDEHFEDQMNEIIKLCPVSRQTMLFSATMTDQVEELVRLSLNHPVRLFVDSNTDVADNLRQEFIRIKTKKEGDREAIVTALCCRTFKEHCLVFLQTKKAVHRLRIIFGLLGLNSTELHGNLSQLQRIEALKLFKDREVDFLLATDLAARGLDIERVKTVINVSMPSTVKNYIHRVGRTARAGRSGRSITLVGEKERKVLKEIIKQAKTPVKNRIIPSEVIIKYRGKIRSLEAEIKQILKQEEEEKQLRLTEMEINKATNLIEHRDEIMSRPARTWIKTTGRKRPAPDGSGKRDKEIDDPISGVLSKKAKREEIKKGLAKKRKSADSEEHKTSISVKREQEYAVRAAKRVRKKKKAFHQGDDKLRKTGKVKSRPVINPFDSELTSTSKKKMSKQSVGMPSRVAKGAGFKTKKRYKRR